MSERRVLQWRPKTAAPVVEACPSQHVWTMVKGQSQIDCVLQQENAARWNIQVFLNRQWFFRIRCLSWADAVEAAENKYEELSRSGWAPQDIRGRIPGWTVEPTTLSN
jgi:hypothetical protein